MCFIEKGKLNFMEVSKKILSSETYEVLRKYECFEKIQKVLDEPLICPCDFFDFVYFFRNTKVTRIIKDQKEIIVNDTQPNQIFMIDYRGESFPNIGKKQKEYINKYNLGDCDMIAEAYDKDLNDFVILLYKENDENEYNEVRKLLYPEFFNCKKL